MKTLVSLISVFIVVHAFADDLQTNAKPLTDSDSVDGVRGMCRADIINKPKVELVAPVQVVEAPTVQVNRVECVKSELSEVAKTTEANAQTIAQIQAIKAKAEGEHQYVCNLCQNYFGSNSVNDGSVQETQALEQQETIQQLCETVVMDLRQQGIEDEQISEIFEAISMMKKRGFTTQQIEFFIKVLIAEIERPGVSKPSENNSDLEDTLLIAASTGVIGVLMGIGLSYWMSPSRPATSKK